MTTALTALQVLGVVAVLVGVAVLAPLGWALVVDGVLVVAVATAWELTVRKAPSAPSDRRSGSTGPEVE